jgi:CheY-like chemotaxis protein
MLEIILVEDNPRLRSALRSGLEVERQAHVAFDCDQGETALEYCLEAQPELTKSVILMDVQLAGEMNGVQAAVAIRREFPRLPSGVLLHPG